MSNDLAIFAISIKLIDLLAFVPTCRTCCRLARNMQLLLPSPDTANLNGLMVKFKALDLETTL